MRSLAVFIAGLIVNCEIGNISPVAASPYAVEGGDAGLSCACAFSAPPVVASYAFALREAQRCSNRKALKELRAIGPPPYSASQVLKERTWIQRFDGQPLGERAVEYRTPRGFSQQTLWPEASKLNLLKLAPALQMPVFFFLGRRDHRVPPETSAAYFEVLVAPLKKLVWFEKSGHEPFVDEPAKFNAAMVDLVRTTAAVPQ